MLFRNLILFRLQKAWTGTAAELEEALATRPLRPCGSLDLQTRGWVVCHEQGDGLVHAHGPHSLMAMGEERKLLPASVINQEARQRGGILAEAQGHPPSRRQMREIKAQVADELRARALTQRRVVHAWLAADRGWLAINASAAGRAEALVEVLRNTLGGFPVQPLSVRKSLPEAMAAWLGTAGPPSGFDIDQDLELRGAGARIRYSGHPLDSPEIHQHLAAGKLPVRLGLAWRGRIAFVLDEQLQLRRLRFLDILADDQLQGEDPAEQFAIDFALMTGELEQLLSELFDALGGVEVKNSGPA